jgi:hypothetical protein
LTLALREQCMHLAIFSATLLLNPQDENCSKIQKNR